MNIIDMVNQNLADKKKEKDHSIVTMVDKGNSLDKEFKCSCGFVGNFSEMFKHELEHLDN